MSNKNMVNASDFSTPDRWTDSLLEHFERVFDDRICREIPSDEIRLNGPASVIASLLELAEAAVELWDEYNSMAILMTVESANSGERPPRIDVSQLLADWEDDQPQCLQTWFVPLSAAMIHCRVLKNIPWDELSIACCMGLSEAFHPWHICYVLMDQARKSLLSRFSSVSLRGALAHLK
jgi:hypothetical protein